MMHANPLLLFVIACLGVIPLAGYMGEATEHLASRTGPAVGGLLNATFGNAAELIIAIVALNAGLVNLVKASITGSILGNLLLIMGLCFVAGGTRQATLRFNRVSAGASAGMLALAVVGLVFPALFHNLRPDVGAGRELRLTEAVAVVLAITYLFSLLFSLRTHRSLFSGEPHPMVGEVWGPPKAMLVLALATAGVVVQSEILVHAVQGVTATMGFSETFLGLIIVPIIGNAAEHGTAVLVARKGQMDLALQIALGSSTQIALLVAPVLVLVGIIIGRPMDLVFSTFEVAAVGLTVIVTAIITLDGESNWFEGVQLLAMYALVAAMAFFV
jgi:Ca2+:H+ antiporter